MLKIAAVVFLIFATNVVLGSAGYPQFLGDVSELLVVMTSVAFFVIAIIRREQDAQAQSTAEE